MHKFLKWLLEAQLGKVKLLVEVFLVVRRRSGADLRLIDNLLATAIAWTR